MSGRASALRLLAVFALGVACGLWVTPLLVGPRMQQLRLERDEAAARVEALEAEVTRLRELARQHRQVPTVNRVRVELTGADRRTLLEAERRLTQQLSERQVGRPVDQVSAMMVYGMLQGTDWTIDGVRYNLDIRFMVIGPELTLYGQLTPVGQE
ncbi:MAG TPA: hypothetical protein VIL07_09925 [Symbiobacteriaceae bacterium]